MLKKYDPFHDWNARSGEERLFQVRWMLQPGIAALENVQVRINDGFLTDIIPMSTRQQDQLIDGILIPPLVNSHTHLEFSQLKTPLAPAVPFQSWISRVIQNRIDLANQEPLSDGTDPTESSISAGLNESHRCGVAGIGEITTHSISSELASRFAKQNVVSFRECIGLQSEATRTQLRNCHDHLECQPANGRHGISPHAPYSVHPDLFDNLIQLAVDRSAPVAMHLAETQDEIELLQHGTGRFAAFLQDRGLHPERVFGGGFRILSYLQSLARLPNSLAIHCNYLSATECEFLIRHPNIAVVYCPRTHHFFQHQNHPWRSLKAAGARVVLGTDSRASNPDLNIWKELQFVAVQNPDVAIEELLPMVTTDAAKALNLPHEDFALQTGRPFDAVLLTANQPNAKSALPLHLQNAIRQMALSATQRFFDGELIECQD